MGCIPFEKPYIHYKDYYANISDYEVTLEILYIEGLDSIAKRTLNIPPGEEREGLYGGPGSGFVGGDGPILQYMHNFSFYEVIVLSVNDTLVREWSRLEENEMNVNSPFNHDSWVVELYDSIIEGVHGRMTFTITNADITK